MIDNYGFMLLGWQIDQEKLDEVLEHTNIPNGKYTINDFDSFLEEYSYWMEEPESHKVVYIPDSMFGQTGYFGVLVHAEDLEEDQDEAYVIPEKDEYMEILMDFINNNKELYSKVQECASRPEPKYMFAICKF